MHFASCGVKPFRGGSFCCFSFSAFSDASSSRTRMPRNGFWSSLRRSTMKDAVAESAAIQTLRILSRGTSLSIKRSTQSYPSDVLIRFRSRWRTKSQNSLTFGRRAACRASSASALEPAFRGVLLEGFHEVERRRRALRDLAQIGDLVVFADPGMLDVGGGLPSGLDQERHETLDVARRGLVAAALQQIDGVQLQQLLVAERYPQPAKSGRRFRHPAVPDPGVFFPAEGVQVLMGKFERVGHERLGGARRPGGLGTEAGPLGLDPSVDGAELDIGFPLVVGLEAGPYLRLADKQAQVGGTFLRIQ